MQSFFKKIKENFMIIQENKFSHYVEFHHKSIIRVTRDM